MKTSLREDGSIRMDHVQSTKWGIVEGLLIGLTIGFIIGGIVISYLGS